LQGIPPASSIAELLAQHLKIAPADYTAFMQLAYPDLPPELLKETTRLLTLLGSGGTGKTRLSLEIAARLQDEFADS
jgi:hypothetical protein